MKTLAIVALVSAVFYDIGWNADIREVPSVIHTSTRATHIPTRNDVDEFDERSGGTYGSLTDVRDGKTYKTVKIGSQVWMAENLNYDNEYNEGTARSYCYEDDPAMCGKYGRLYTWAAAMDSATTGCGVSYGKTCSATKPVRGVCPEGWHLPDPTEWNALEKFVADSLYNGKTDSVGYALKSKSGWTEYDGKTGGSDYFGFGALPAGGRTSSGDFSGFQLCAWFWSPTESNLGNAYFWKLEYQHTRFSATDFYKNQANSVRCVKD